MYEHCFIDFMDITDTVTGKDNHERPNAAIL
jgi:hypothetical protein